MKDHCYLLPRGSGGNVLVNDEITIRRTAGIGDAVAATVVADRLIQLGFEVNFQTATPIHCVLRRHPRLNAIAPPYGHCTVDLDGAYENNRARTRKHFHEMFFEVANAQLKPRDIYLGEPRNSRPRLVVASNEHQSALSRLAPYAQPWVFICPQSESFNVRQVPDGIWREVAAQTTGTKFWMGKHPAPPGIVDLELRHLDTLVALLSACDLLVSVDTGPMHIAAALGKPIVAIGQSSSPELHLSDLCDYSVVSPNLDCLNCQKNVCPINADTPPCQNVDPHLIANGIADKLSSLNGAEVSAIISVYQPEVDTLNQCLSNIIPQVSEVIVCRDLEGIFPPGAVHHPKVKYITKPAKDIGYGRKVNYAVRYSSGRFLLFLNDDCFMHPGAVDRMREQMAEKVGMVSPLLRYPSGLIYHAGKVRSPGMRGWAHINHNQWDYDFKEPTELENCCGACVLVRREAFYQAGCFDEDFYLYAEDDAFALAMRRAGYKIMFTPYAQGIHLEHQSTRKTPFIVDIMHASNRLFTEKWAAYLDWNSNRVPLGDFRYLSK